MAEYPRLVAIFSKALYTSEKNGLDRSGTMMPMVFDDPVRSALAIEFGR